jgi:hypothetical protein
MSVAGELRMSSLARVTTKRSILLIPEIKEIKNLYYGDFNAPMERYRIPVL